MDTVIHALAERRKAVRLELQMRCLLVGQGGQVTGVTQNLSRSGILVRCRQGDAFAKRTYPGLTFKAYLEMPAQGRDPKRALYCHCSLVRTTVLDSGDLVVALAVLHMQFRDIPHRFTADNCASGGTLVI